MVRDECRLQPFKTDQHSDWTGPRLFALWKSYNHAKSRQKLQVDSSSFELEKKHYICTYFFKNKFSEKLRHSKKKEISSLIKKTCPLIFKIYPNVLCFDL